MMSRGKHVARRPKGGRTRTFGRAVPLALALLMVMAAVAWADQVEADADALSTVVPQSNNVNANQQPGTTVAYDLSAHIKGTGAAANKVFQQAGDSVLVTIARSGAWLATTPDGGTPAAFTFTGYDANQAGTIRVTVPCGTEAGTVEVMTAVLTGTPTTGQLNPDTRNLTYTITAQGADHASCAPANNPPVVSAGDPYSGDEGAAISIIGSASDTDGPLPLTTVWTATKTAGHVNAACAFGDAGQLATTITCNDNGTWTLRLTATDGAGATAFDETTLTVDNVRPTASLVRSGPPNVLTGTTVTYNASATDPSTVDTAAGFLWSFNNGAWTVDAQHQPTYTSCGSKTESVRAQDKDGGISLLPATAGVSVYDGDWHGAIKPAVRNQVQAGRVVPVQIRIGCEGVPLTGLTPGIRLLTGDQDPDTTAFDEAVATTTSVSSADTTGFMRETSDGYIYNLQIPKNAKAGDMFTIAVRPWGSDGPQLRAVVEIRK